MLLSRLLRFASLLLLLSALPVSAQQVKASPVLTLTSVSTIFPGQSIPLTAQLSTSAGSPTGQISFVSSGVVLGSAVVGSTGSATLTISTLPIGTNQIVATYAGDDNFNPAASAPDPVIVIDENNPTPFVSPTTLSFPTQVEGTTSAPQTLTLSYSNSNPITINSLTITGDFAQTNTCLGITAGQCNIYVTFTPTEMGRRTGTLTVTGSPTASPVEVGLSGTTLPATVGPTTTSIISSGTPGNYLLTGAVVGMASSNVLAGEVSFLDASNNNLSLGNATLGASTSSLALSALSPPLTGVGPNALVVGDFNGDGKPDIVTVNSGSAGGRLVSAPPSILMGNGDGTFSVSTIQVTATNPSIIAAGDFNGDGKIDLVFDGGPNYDLIVLLGNGDGTFAALPTPVTNFDPSSVAVGDFNGDGKLDLAITKASGVMVMLGNGNATFMPPQITYQTGAGPSSIAVADFNNDGKLDMAIQSDDGSVTVLIGVGDGTFTAAPTVFSQGGGESLALIVGDFNGDGKPDLATSFFADEPAVTTLAVLLGNGDGTFNLVFDATNDPDLQTSCVAAADFNGDGKTDLVLADNQNVSIMLSNGDGTFAVAASKTGALTYPNYFPCVTGDFNSDGVPDIATADSDLNTVGIFLTQRIQSAVASLGNVSVPGSGTHNVLAGYVGTSNFIASASTPTPLTASQITTALALTSSSNSSVSGAPLTLTATLTPYSVGSLITSDESVSFYSNGVSLGTGTLTSGTATLNTSALSAGNDTLTATYVGDSNFISATSSTQVMVIQGNPSATLTAPATTPPGSQTAATFTLQAPYPVPIVATFALNDKSGVASGATDPAVQFATGGTSYTVTIPAGTTSLPAIQIQAGTIAATITVPVTLTANGVNVTPANLAPVSIAVPPAVPAVITTSVARSGKQLTITETGFSNTREIASASFHFTPVSGTSLTTADFTAPVNPAFTTWFANPASLTYGSAFSYSQVFNVSDDASKIASVQVTLTNTVGASTMRSAQ
jgi:Bacterial Ig-like domain (group 3)/FG-GAP-like repeat